MKPLTAEWVEKAEGDFATMTREARVRKQPNPDAVCFHAQQCAEKYLKARLIEADLAPRKTHDLSALLEECLEFEPHWISFLEDFGFLSDFAIHYRYPGESAELEEAKHARSICRRFRTAARQWFTGK